MSDLLRSQESAVTAAEPLGKSQCMTSQNWYALCVRSRYERIVATFLKNHGYEWFLPMYESRRRWFDQIKVVEVPLFPGYLFCRFDIHNRLPILKIPGVRHVVGGARIPTPIDTSEIHALQTVIRANAPREPWPFLQVGDRLRIEHGSLVGVEGVLLRIKGRQRLVLSVTLVQRSIAVDIDSAWVGLVSRRDTVEVRPVRLDGDHDQTRFARGGHPLQIDAGRGV
jgi:transcription antitermination factor NusG